MRVSKNTPKDTGLEYSIANAIATKGESVRLQLTDMLNNTPHFFATQFQPFESGCTDEKLAEFLMFFFKVCIHIAQLEVELEIQKGKAEISKLVKLAASEVGMSDMEFAITTDENDDDDDDEYVFERVKDLMNMPIDDWAHFEGYAIELREEISRASCSV